MQSCFSKTYGLSSGVRHSLQLYRKRTKIRFWAHSVSTDFSRSRALGSFFKNLLLAARVFYLTEPHCIGFGPCFNISYSLKKWIGSMRRPIKKSKYAGWGLSNVKLKLTAQGAVESTKYLLVPSYFWALSALPLGKAVRKESLPFLWQTSHFSYLDRGSLQLLGTRLSNKNLYGLGQILICGPLLLGHQPLVVSLPDLSVYKRRLRKFYSTLSRQYLGIWWERHLAYVKNDKEKIFCPLLRSRFLWNALALKNAREDFLGLFELEDVCRYSFYRFRTTILLPSVLRFTPRHRYLMWKPYLNILLNKFVKYQVAYTPVYDKLPQTRFVKPLGFYLLRRLIFMLTKRGERRRVYGILWKTIALLRTQRGGKDVQELSMLLKNLRPKFSLRKKMVGRRAVLLPGILPNSKKLNVVARWLVRSLYLKRERSLDRELARLLFETIANNGPAVKLKKQFEILVGHSLNNLRTQQRRPSRRGVY